MDEAGLDTAHLAGNSLGGYVALQLAARGRARSVVAFAPAGGWAEGDPAFSDTMDYFVTAQDLVRAAAPHADEIVSSVEGRRRATLYTTNSVEHIPAELLAHQIRGAAACEGALALIARARSAGYPVDTGRIECPARIVLCHEAKILTCPRQSVPPCE